MNKRLLLLFGSLTILVTGVAYLRGTVGAQNNTIPPEQTCRDRIQLELTGIVYDYRAHIFGSRDALSSDISIPITGGFSFREPIEGILETRGRLTSELVAPLVESYRGLRCRALSVCSVMEQSFDELGGDVTFAELGCPEVTVPRFDECNFRAGTDTVADDEGQSATVTMLTECNQLVESTLQMERAILELAVTYDAGYRSNMQLAGMHDKMMQSLSKDALTTTAGTVNILGKLHQIPCFIGQCDAPDTASLSE
jgi:hypothetical protein